MQQSSVIFFFLFAAFIVFVTQRGELPTYLGLLLLSPASGSTGGTSSGTVNSASIGANGITNASSAAAGATSNPAVAGALY